MSDETYSVTDPVTDPATETVPTGTASGEEVGLQPMPAYWGEDQLQPLSEEPAFEDFEYGPAVTFVDSDYNGTWNHAVLDVDGDGRADLLASVQGEGILLAVDPDGDGQFNQTELVTMEQLVSIDPALAELLAQNLEMTPPDDAEFAPIQVDPEAMDQTSPYWFEQAANGLCAPASVAQVVAEYTGMTFENEAEFVELANEYGLFMVGPDGVPGMSIEGSLFLLEQAGVPASLVQSANLEMLDGYVDAGHGVVLFVNSTEIWYGETGSGAADHALVVIDILPEEGIAILSDPGRPEGNGFEVPIEVLEEAWAAGNNTMLIAEEPAPTGGGTATMETATTGTVTAEPGVTAEPFGDAGVTDDASVTSVSAPGGATESVGTAFTPAADGVALEGIELHTSIPAGIQWVVDRPWILLPVALAASRLIPRRQA